MGAPCGADGTFDDDGVEDALRGMFCQQYGLTRPWLPLDRVPHWDKVAAVLAPELAGAGAPRAWMAAGFFFAVSIAAPNAQAIAAARDQAFAADADCAVFAMLRAPVSEDDAILLPWFIESAYRVDADPDADLVLLLGAKRAREIRRVTRKAAVDYEFTIEPLTPSSEAMAALARLLQLNARKHGYETSPYDGSVLARLASSALGARAMVACQRERAGGRIVQASLALVDHARGVMYQLVQGIDHAVVPAGQNLYVADTLSLYRWGHAQGLRHFNLGRGGARNKLNLGANHFRVLGNLVVTTAHGAARREALRRGAARMAMAIEHELAALATVARRRGVARLMTWDAGAARGHIHVDAAIDGVA